MNPQDSGRHRVVEGLAIKASQPSDEKRSAEIVRLLRRHLVRQDPWGPDDRLHRAAWTAMRYTEGLDGVQVDGVLEETFDGEGVFDTLVFPVESWSDSLEEAVSRVASTLREEFRTTAFNRLGIAAEQMGSGWRVLALVADRKVEINADTRLFPVGSAYALRGLLLEARNEAKVMVLSPDGIVHEVQSWIEGRQMGAEIPMNQVGQYRVEVIFDKGNGVPEIPAALISINCGPAETENKKEVEIPRFRLQPNQVSGRSRAGKMTTEIWTRSMDLRKRRGLELLNWDRNLEKLADIHASYLAKKRTLAHVDSKGRGPLERVLEKGVSASSVGENIAAGLSAEGIQSALERSPSHLQQLLRKDITRMGIGTATRDNVVFVVQIMAGP